MTRDCYLLKFKDLEINDIFYKKYSRLDAAKLAKNKMEKDKNIKLICLERFDYKFMVKVKLENYEEWL